MISLLVLLCSLGASAESSSATSSPPRPPVTRCHDETTLRQCYNPKAGPGIPICSKGDSTACRNGCPTCFPLENLVRCAAPPTISCEELIRNKGLGAFTVTWDADTKTFCPPCYRKTVRGECTEDQGKECKQKIEGGQIRQCDEDEHPGIENCCVTCIAKRECKPMDELKPCASLEDVVGKYGCWSCRPSAVMRPSNDDCTSMQFREYKKLVPECTATEKPQLNRSMLTCGPSCVRAASKKHLLEVIACKKQLPQCKDDDTSKRNFFLPGQACPLCEPKRPGCPVKCDGNKVCVRGRQKDKKCVRKRRIVLRIVLKKILRSGLHNISKSDMTGILKELLQRYCERNAQESRCTPNLERILDSLDCTRLREQTEAEVTDESMVYEVDVEIAESESEDDMSSELLEDAVKDDDDYVESAQSTLPSSIPAEKMCLVPDTILKCRLLGYKMPICEKVRPKCERKLVVDEKKNPKFLMACPTCLPSEFLGHLCKEKVAMACTKGVNRTEKFVPSKKSICPSCFKIPEKEECSWEDKKNCLKKLKSGEIPTCVENEVAIKKDCCFSCRIAIKPTEDKCPPSNLETCDEPDSKKDKDQRESRKISGQRDLNGCRKCAPRGPIRKLKTRCSIADFRQYKQLAPTCESGEIGFVNKNSTRCGPPCVRPASKKDLSQVMACAKNLQECESDDESNRFIYLPDAACPICEPLKPLCGCESNEVCVRTKLKTRGPKCVMKKKINLLLKFKVGILRQAQNLTKKAFARIMIEFVERYCERNNEAERCSKALDVIRDSLKCTNKIDHTDGVEAEIEFGEDSEAVTGRRLLSEDGAEAGQFTIDLLEDATKDDDTYVSGVTIGQSEPTDASTATLLKSSIFFTSLVVAFGTFRF